MYSKKKILEFSMIDNHTCWMVNAVALNIIMSTTNIIDYYFIVRFTHVDFSDYRDLYWCARTSKWGDLLPVVKTTLKPRRSRKSQPVSDEQLVSMPADGAENVNEQPST